MWNEDNIVFKALGLPVFAMGFILMGCFICFGLAVTAFGNGASRASGMIAWKEKQPDPHDE